MEFDHKPVLLNECIEYLNIIPEGVYLDGTIGGAGHSAEILKRLGHNGFLIGLDQDNTALEASRQRLTALNAQAGFILENTNFKYVKEVCVKHSVAGVDGALFDLGASSHQFDEHSRGFSYMNDAPLDMRMDKRNRLNAEIIVNEYDERKLGKLIRDYGEENWASRIAGFIVKARESKRITTTHELVEIIKAAIPSSARREGPHPAKRTFQAIRIAVNDELTVLSEVIDSVMGILKPGGRLCIISFHSLEDRIVKTQFQKMVKPCTCPEDFPVCVCGKKPLAEHITKKPVLPSENEVNGNPRARSAKLRVIQKL